MILIQPLGFLAYMGSEFAEENIKENWKKFLKRLCPIVVICLVSLFIVKMVNFITFSSEEWKDYYKSNDFNMYVIDYNPPIPYDSFSDVFIKNGISRNDYEQSLEYRFWPADNSFSGKKTEEVLPIAENIRKAQLRDSFSFEAIKQLLFSSTQFWHLHQIAAVFFLLLIFFALSMKKPRYLIAILSSFAGYLMGIVILAYRNRFVLRVMMPYYLGALLVLAVLFFIMIRDLDLKKRKVLIIINGILTLSLMIWCLQSGRVQFAYFRSQNHFVNNGYYLSMKDIEDYCKAHPENHYILDMSYARNVSTDIFESDYYLDANYIYSGSWYSNAPTMLEYSRNYIGDDCCYLVYETQEIKGMEGAEFFAGKLNTIPVLEDKFVITGGPTIWVYRIKGE